MLSKESAKAGEEWVAWCLANGMRKSANIVAKALLATQIKRVTTGDRFQSFADRAAAEAWLDAPG